MAKGYWAGQVFEIRNQERFDRYVEKAMAIFAEEAAKGTGNFVPLAVGEPALDQQRLREHRQLLLTCDQRFPREI